MEQAIAEAARIAGAVVDVDEGGRAEESRTGPPGRTQSRPGPQGLLQQQEQILFQGTTTSTTSASPPSTQVVVSSATVTAIATPPTSTPMAASTATSGATLTVSAPTQTSQATGDAGQVPIVKNLSGTLANCSLCQEFRDYLILLDSKIPKPKFQVKLICATSLDDAKHAGLVGPGSFVPEHIFSARG